MTPAMLEPAGAAQPRRNPVRDYLRLAGLETLSGREGDVERAVRDLVEAMAGEVAVADPSSLYTYPVPVMSEDGTCSIVDKLAPVHYDLTGILGGRTEQSTRRLALLGRILARARETTGADWLGIYQKRINAAGLPVLVKLAYVGRPSRAEFPLDPEFAKRSTNSTVGLTARATVIHDVSRHVEAGGGFYVCDDGVQSEACVPILTQAGEVAGIVDAEAMPRAFFGADRLAIVAAVALVAPPVLP